MKKKKSHLFRCDLEEGFRLEQNLLTGMLDTLTLC